MSSSQPRRCAARFGKVLGKNSSSPDLTAFSGMGPPDGSSGSNKILGLGSSGSAPPTPTRTYDSDTLSCYTSSEKTSPYPMVIASAEAAGEENLGRPPALLLSLSSARTVSSSSHITIGSSPRDPLSTTLPRLGCPTGTSPPGSTSSVTTEVSPFASMAIAATLNSTVTWGPSSSEEAPDSRTMAAQGLACPTNKLNPSASCSDARTPNKSPGTRVATRLGALFHKQPQVSAVPPPIPSFALSSPVASDVCGYYPLIQGESVGTSPPATVPSTPPSHAVRRSSKARTADALCMLVALAEESRRFQRQQIKRYLLSELGARGLSKEEAQASFAFATQPLLAKLNEQYAELIARLRQTWEDHSMVSVEERYLMIRQRLCLQLLWLTPMTIMASGSNILMINSAPSCATPSRPSEPSRLLRSARCDDKNTVSHNVHFFAVPVRPVNTKMLKECRSEASEAKAGCPAFLAVELPLLKRSYLAPPLDFIHSLSSRHANRIRSWSTDSADV